MATTLDTIDSAGTADWNSDKYDYAAQDPELGRPCVLSDFPQAFQDDVIEASESSGDEALYKWSMIVKDLIKNQNRKIADTVLIFNFGSATECPNGDTDHCQVDFEDCYARQSELLYKEAIQYRRKQAFVRDSLDADTFGKAASLAISRKRNPVDTLRLSQAGDFGSDGDILWANRVTEILRADHDIDVYTYSASDYLNWELREGYTLNASNPNFDGQEDRRFMAFMNPEDIPDDVVLCPNDRDKRVLGKSPDDAIKCGECRLCINPEGPDVGILIH